ncbi:MAG: polyprenyl p-hydroxybenzoate/phenylacrylic acid decarboxylase [Deltaproteobacteria bacterium]|nr:polyprenyl p-hydroxybenzoate/phenylacrylic acid decarboxylase [Deltaproteobacteria bacterium]
MKRLVVGISGATGAIYGIRLLEFLSKSDVETHLVVSTSAEKTIRMETSWTLEQVKALATVTYNMEDVGADISSGSFHAEGMVVIPCSIKSLSAIANSYNENLLVRAADVALKERRKLVLVVRETPLHRGHLSLMLNVADAGGVILPPIPAFYFLPKTLDDIINHTVGRVLDVFEIDHHLFNRWGSQKLKNALKKKGTSN